MRSRRRGIDMKAIGRSAAAPFKPTLTITESWKAQGGPIDRPPHSKHTSVAVFRQGSLLDHTQASAIIVDMRAKRRTSMSDRIRELIDQCGLSRYAIWKATGIDQATLSRFMTGGGLSMDNLDKLADHLDLTITTARRRRSKGR